MVKDGPALFDSGRGRIRRPLRSIGVPDVGSRLARSARSPPLGPLCRLPHPSLGTLGKPLGTLLGGAGKSLGALLRPANEGLHVHAGTATAPTA